MIETLTDKSKLVRWRAARFLYEVGTEEAEQALRLAAEDPEFEVSLQAKMALERIESGEQAAGTVWQQMAGRNKIRSRCVFSPSLGIAKASWKHSNICHCTVNQ